MTPDCSLPSLFFACHEPPYKEGAPGYGSWPATKWNWGERVTTKRGVHRTHLHGGRTLYLSDETVALADPLCRAELAATARDINQD